MNVLDIIKTTLLLRVITNEFVEDESGGFDVVEGV